MEKEVNMLLIGQTGVGKSTFINSLAYYLNCKDLKEAMSADLHCLIPCAFTLTNENYEDSVIEYGDKKDGNENTECKGQSATQKCKSYLFEMDEFVLRLIDTPGIGDTRGIDQDKLNLEDILDYIASYKHLNGICILLKPNESRLTATFEYCLKQLLCHLHKNASKNIIFVFTNCRANFYRPGDTIVPLKEILNELKKSVEIPLSDNNIVCVDNEAFRYLIALKNNFKFEKVVSKNYNASWKKSVQEIWRLMNLMTSKDGVAHSTEETLTLNEVKDMIVSLAKPISEISQLFQQNFDRVNKHLDDLQNNNEDCEELDDKFYVPEVKLKVEEVDEPRTVCSSETCRQIVEDDGLMQYHYPKICHNPCYLKNVPRNTDGLEELKRCYAMGDTENCKKCNCCYLKHRHIYYLSHLIEIKKIDENTQFKLYAANDFKERIEIIINSCEERKTKLKGEVDLIIQNLAILTAFLKQNAILPYNDTFSRYLRQLIEIEESLQVAGADNDSVIKGLNDMLDRYEKEKVVIEDAISKSSSSHQISVEEAKRLIDEILGLEISGNVLKSILKFRFKTRSKEINNDEVKVPIKITASPPKKHISK